MDRMPQGWDALTQDPLPYVRGLSDLIPERRLAAILSRTARSSERRRRLPADSVIWLIIAMALFAADSIPKVWRRLHPTRDRPEPTDSAFSQARRRLGVAPLRHLFLETARPMATPPDRGRLLPRLAADGPGPAPRSTCPTPRTTHAPSAGPRPTAPRGPFPRSGSWPSVSWARTPSAAWRSSRSVTASRRWSASYSTTSGPACS